MPEGIRGDPGNCIPDRDARSSARPEKASVTVYRVQDVGGRGPYRPGFSAQWVDDPCPFRPTFMEEFGWDLVSRMDPRNANGCAFESIEQFERWFTPSEQRRLCALGFFLVELTVDRVLARSEHQLVVTRRTPFRYATVRLPWPAGSAEGVAAQTEDRGPGRPT